MELKSVTPRPGNLKQHISKLGEKKYKCGKCDYSTYWSSHLRSHSQIHAGKKFKCEKCDYSTPRDSYLKKHNRIHTGEQYKCEKCDYSTTENYNLKRHRNVHRIHTGEKYKCEKCDYSTTENYNLKRHRNVHTIWPPNLKRHKHIHSLAKSKQDNDQELKNTKEVFLCKICDLTFLTNMNLKKHNMKHSTNDQHYSCHLCTFSAEQSVNLEAHLLVRHAL